MAETVVASAVQWIGSVLIQEGSTLLDIADQVGGLHQDLALMQQYLQDADAKQESGICTLICQIRNLTYDAEDLIDTYIIKVQPRTGQFNRSRIMRYACCLYTSPTIYELGKQIQVIQSSIKCTMDKLSAYGVRKMPELRQTFSLSHNEGHQRRRRRSYPYDDDNGDYVVGLEKDIRKLVEVLMGERQSQVNVLAIVGMGGSGKTTLARKL